MAAVLFDVGGPIDAETSYEAAINRDIQACLAAQGIAVDASRYAAAERIAVERFAPNAYQAIIWSLVGGDAQCAATVWRAVVARAGCYDFFDLRPGVADLIRDLKRRGVRLGLAANQPSRALARLDAIGIGGCFDHREVSGTNGLRKPDPRVFLAAAAALAVAPADCIMVGDRIDNDIAPARSLGMRTIRLVAGRHAAQRARSWLDTPDIEVSGVGDLQAALDRLLAADTA